MGLNNPFRWAINSVHRAKPRAETQTGGGGANRGLGVILWSKPRDLR